MDFFVQALRHHPELAIFLTLAIGFLSGRVKFGSFSLGIVVGTLPRCARYRRRCVATSFAAPAALLVELPAFWFVALAPALPVRKASGHADGAAQTF